MKSRCNVEKTLKIPFEEANLVRVRCKRCGVVRDGERPTRLSGVREGLAEVRRERG